MKNQGCDIGLIGLGVMGRNLVLNMADQGFSVAVYNRTTGKTREFIEKEIPHVSELLCSSASDLIAKSEVVVVANKDREYAALLQKATEHQVIVDLVRLFDPEKHPQAGYYGICW